MVATTGTLPHWDMTVVYPSLESPEFDEGFRSVVEEISALSVLFDKYQIGEQQGQQGQLGQQSALDDQTVGRFDDVINHYNQVLDKTHTLSAYIESFVSTNSRDDTAQAKLSELQQHTVRLSQLGTRLTAWIGSLDIDTLITLSPIAKAHEYMLRRARIRSTHLMSPPEEALAAELNLSGGSAWTRLHGNVTSQLSVPVEVNGESQELPMSMVRNLAYEPDRDLRRRAYEAELAGWQRVEVPIAAALNGVKGEVSTLARHRGWGSALDAALFDSSIDHATLDAMMLAAHESFPDFRRYLRAKAHALGLDVLAWYDIFAPVGRSSRLWEYDKATNFIVEQFGAYSPKMSDFAARAFREQWIDAEPRSGKRDGAFCMPLRDDESRVFTNYKPAYDGMSTLAHELGHGYHNFVKAERTALQRSTPMTLAETASIFCETIVRQAALKDADKQEQISIL
ncbi:MAG: oligoendopeptidase F, partial [Chloroflexi bacterium]|nr:oligoendopeptidase F [Chloroflexota bacterium]